MFLLTFNYLLTQKKKVFHLLFSPNSVALSSTPPPHSSTELSTPPQLASVNHMMVTWRWWTSHGGTSSTPAWPLHFGHSPSLRPPARRLPTSPHSWRSPPASPSCSCLVRSAGEKQADGGSEWAPITCRIQVERHQMSCHVMSNVIWHFNSSGGWDCTSRETSSPIHNLGHSKNGRKRHHFTYILVVL